MKTLLLVLASWVGLASAVQNTSAITGVWRGQMDGLPAVEMNISDEGGELTGAIVFYLIRHNDGQPPRSSPGGPEPLFNMKFDGTTLSFRVSHRRAHPPRTLNDPPVSFQVRITGKHEGVLTREGKDPFRLTRVN